MRNFVLDFARDVRQSDWFLGANRIVSEAVDSELQSKIVARDESAIAHDAAELAPASIELTLFLTPEERIDAHGHALQLMLDLQEAGRVARATESQSAP